MSGRTQRRAWALILAGLVALQGCGAVGRRTVDPAQAQAQVQLETTRSPATPLALLRGSAPAPAARGLQPTCGQFFKLENRDALLLVGVLVLAGPFLIVYEVLTAPLEFISDRL